MNNKMHKCVGRSNCYACQLRQTMVCSGVGLDELASFHNPIDDFVFTPGAVLYHMAEPAQAVHCVRAGAIKLVRFDASGNQRIVRILQRNDIAGLEAIFPGKHQHTAIAIDEVHTCRIPMSHFHNFIAKHPGVQMHLLEKSQAALLEADQWLSDLVANTVPARVRLTRLLLRLRIGDSDAIHRLSLADAGAILGVTPETLSRILREFIDGGILMKIGKGMAGRHYRGDIAALDLISRGA